MISVSGKSTCILVLATLLAGFASAPSWAEIQIEWIGISADYGRVDGVPDVNPVDLYVEVYGSGIATVSITTEKGNEFEMESEEDGIWEYEWSGYPDLEGIGDDPLVGFGDFRFDFDGELGGSDFVILPYDPGPSYPLLGYCDVTSPAHTATGVDLDPVLTWVCEDTEGDCGTDGWLAYLEADDFDLVYNEWIDDRSQLSWVPGPIAPNSSYGFSCQAVKWLHGTPATWTTLVEEEEFLYRAAYYTGESIEFEARERIVLYLSKQLPGLLWTPLTDETTYDIVLGDLHALLDSSGDYEQATLACIGAGVPDTSLVLAANPGPGEAWWLLVRGSQADEGYESLHASQVEERNPEIDASGNDCR